jgi:pimeloyl-ACP methyl ester carboxylesterase
VADTADLKAAVALCGRGVAATTTMLRDVHLAIARRAFGATGQAGRPARLLHDGISQVVYAAVGGGARVAATATGVAVAARAATDPAYRPLSQRPRGNVAISALNGAWGDLLARTRNPLALAMTVRVDGTDVAVRRDELERAFPGAGGDVAVFVHGLCESDASWRLAGQRHHGDPQSTHGSRLQADTGLTPVYLRYNTGLHISDNGAHLDGLLSVLVEQWPVPVTRLTLVGHSMGGLVIRSACCLDQEGAQRWTPHVKRVVYLGSPHLGAPLEVGAARAARAMQRLPETRPIARALATRSVGIKDLRFGDVLVDDWAIIDDLDAHRAEPQSCAPLLPSAEHFYVGATLARRHDTVAARIIGDAFVPFHSASGEGQVRHLGLQVDRGRHLAGLHHFDLLNHPRVYGVLRGWLGD